MKLAPFVLMALILIIVDVCRSVVRIYVLLTRTV